ncbi:hypothetical protein AAFF_G00309670 [Aldrovandia affinis]|uniref:Uncharacterized protein n=1 Tax=Aldrovandia affinis TaxID=143900 RepID=A0AAD7WRW5_9TELE|nr:hypothetical protein AAFF_G00309670 [Aldrovandia affinis]
MRCARVFLVSHDLFGLRLSRVTGRTGHELFSSVLPLLQTKGQSALCPSIRGALKNMGKKPHLRAGTFEMPTLVLGAMRLPVSCPYASHTMNLLIIYKEDGAQHNTNKIPITAV